MEKYRVINVYGELVGKYDTLPAAISAGQVTHRSFFIREYLPNGQWILPAL